MKDAVATMGGILPDDAGGRDAVHVAVFSAVSNETLFPCQHVAAVGPAGADTRVSPTAEHGTIGVVDPFLRAPVTPGQRVWVYLYPRTITALSHRWSHPAFEVTDTVYVAPSDKLIAEQWLREFCRTADCPGYESVLGKAAEWWDGRVAGWNDEYLHFDGQDAHGELPPEFWDNIAIALGREMYGIREKPTYFSCSC